jgi:hypothetical protein
MIPSSLTTFISHARDKGMDHQTIRMLLLSAGWKEKDISGALASETLSMPVPVPSDAGSARDAFLHLLSFATLYTTVISMIVLSFQYIQKLFPDASEMNYYYDGSSSVVRWSMASIIVAFPLFLFVSRILYKDCATHHEKLSSGVRRWLTYLTLFVTAMTMVGDIITLIFFLLDGELTTRFLLKVISVFVFTGLPFLYYFQTLRMEPGHYAKSSMHVQFRYVAIALVLSAFVSGFFIVGSPSHGRDVRMDEMRVANLQLITSTVYEWVYGATRYSDEPSRLNPIPPTLIDVQDAGVYQQVSVVDPETNEPYEYSVSGNEFTICATFATELQSEYGIFWNHGAGRTCFTHDITDLRTK